MEISFYSEKVCYLKGSIFCKNSPTKSIEIFLQAFALIPTMLYSTGHYLCLYEKTQLLYRSD